MVSLHVAMGLPLILAFPATIILVTLVGMLLDRFAIRPIRRPSVLTLIIATIAVSIIIKGTASLIWGKDPFDLPAFSGRNPINYSGSRGSTPVFLGYRLFGHHSHCSVYIL